MRLRFSLREIDLKSHVESRAFLFYPDCMVSPFEIAAVACGGALGACFRLVVGRFFEVTWTAAKFPFSTFCINILGCFLIGVIAEFSIRNEFHSSLRLFIVTGILGGFTTFSAFGLESVSLLRAGHISLAITYIVASVVGGCTATLLGMLLAAQRNIP